MGQIQLHMKKGTVVLSSLYACREPGKLGRLLLVQNDPLFAIFEDIDVEDTVADVWKRQ
jgi:hypothetical protein